MSDLYFGDKGKIVIPVFKHHAMKVYRCNGSEAPHILNFNARRG